jgi:peptidoglycan hydrolase-like amidase
MDFVIAVTDFGTRFIVSFSGSVLLVDGYLINAYSSSAGGRLRNSLDVI